jgi:putative transposase
MINLTYEYRIEPSCQQEQRMLAWLETCRKVYNYALFERKDWSNSRKCQVNACSLQQEYILPADAPYPNYHRQSKSLTAAKTSIPELREPNAQVLQQTLVTLDKAFDSMRVNGFGYPRFKKQGRDALLAVPTNGHQSPGG